MRKSNHLSFVSIILLSIVLSACQAPTPTPVWPTLTPTVPTPTVTPVPTSTNTPIPTATPTQYPQDPLAWNYENQKVTFIQDGKSYSYYKLTNEQQKIGMVQKHKELD